MTPPGVELRHLRYFVAVADAGTFTHAAERMFIAQPTLSQQIRRLEEMVGTPLLHRRREGVRLTDAGLARLNEDRALAEAVLAQLARIGGKMDRVRQAFAGDEQGDVGHRAVDEARQALRAALIAKINASPSAEELQRVSEVLKRATDELRRGMQ